VNQGSADSLFLPLPSTDREYGTFDWLLAPYRTPDKVHFVESRLSNFLEWTNVVGQSGTTLFIGNNTGIYASWKYGTMMGLHLIG
jgi:hypothetical protein